MNENDLILNKEARNRMMSREDVFNNPKAKALVGFMLPNNFGATTEMVANYFEVGEECINSLVKDNRQELNDNGLETHTGEQLKFLKNTCQIKSRAKAITTFSRRAILNVAMLLRDSQVAKEIRSLLLDASESDAAKQNAFNSADDVLKAQLLMAIYEGGAAAVVATKQLAELETKKAIAPLTTVLEKRVTSNGLRTITDITKSFGFKRGQVSTWAKMNGYIFENGKDVKTKGEAYFKVYGEEYPNVGVIVPTGVQFIEEHKEEIMQSPTKLVKNK